MLVLKVYRLPLRRRVGGHEADGKKNINPASDEVSRRIRDLLLEQWWVGASELLVLYWARINVPPVHRPDERKRLLMMSGQCQLARGVNKHKLGSSMLFIDLPPEILLGIVALLELTDIARIRQVLPAS